MKGDLVLWFIRVILLSLLRDSSSLKAQNGRLRFVVIGDTGGTSYRPYSTIGQRLLSNELAKIRGIDFFVGVGDNFYVNGVRDVDDHRFVQTFEKVYNSPSLFRDWYMIAGNHDYSGNISAQILYTKKSKRWNFPHNFYTRVFNIPKSNKTLQIVMLDTTMLCFGHQRAFRRKFLPQLESQMEWLTRTLENSEANYLIVAGHHPMYSAGWHGPTKCIQKKFAQLFEKHKVTAYFSGHDHNLQHIKTEKSHVEQFVSGSGTFVRPWRSSLWKLEPNSLKQFYGKTPGFLIVTAKANRLKVKFHTTWRRSKYRRFLQPREKWMNNIEFPQLLTDFFHSMNGTQ